jgi:hypothetical protein
MAFQTAIEPAARSARRRRLALRAAGLICGLLAVAASVRSWMIVPTGSVLGTDVGIVAVAPGELLLSGSGQVLRGNRMRPGDASVTGAVRLRNITGTPLRVRFRTLPSRRALDDVLELTFTAGKRWIGGGSAGALRRWSPRQVWIGVHGSTMVEVSARMRRPAEGLIADVTLEFHSESVTS